MTAVLLLGEFRGPGHEELVRLANGLSSFLNMPGRRFRHAASFDELSIVLRCLPQECPGRWPRLRKLNMNGKSVLAAEIKIPIERMKLTLKGNVPVLAEAMSDLFACLQAYYRRAKLPLEEVAAFEEDYWSAFDVPSRRVAKKSHQASRSDG